MKILFSPVVKIGSQEKAIYSFKEGVIKAIMPDGKSDTFDFRGFSEGKMADGGIKSILEEDLVLEAEIVKGELYVILRNYIGVDATEEEKFPDWIEHTEYVAPEITGTEEEAL